MGNHPTLCKNGCGFYSNAGNEGLCSVCYKDIVKKKQAPPTNMPAPFSPAPNSMASLSIEEGAASRQSTSTLDTATTTVPVVMPTEKKPECDLSSCGSRRPCGGSSHYTPCCAPCPAHCLPWINVLHRLAKSFIYLAIY